MNDWKKVSDEDAARIRSGGQWAYIDGVLTPVSTAAIAEQLKDALPQLLDRLANRLAVESMADMEDLSCEVSDDWSEVTVVMLANGHEARGSIPLNASLSA